MTLESVEKAVLFVDLMAVAAFIVFAWLDLRKQVSDIGRVGGVTALIALCFVLYFVGRAFLGA